MDLKLLVTVFATISLVTSSALAVFVGSLIGSHVNARLVGRVAGAGFIAVGVWTLWRA